MGNPFGANEDPSIAHLSRPLCPNALSQIRRAYFPTKHLGEPIAAIYGGISANDGDANMLSPKNTV